MRLLTLSFAATIVVLSLTTTVSALIPNPLFPQKQQQSQPSPPCLACPDAALSRRAWFQSTAALPVAAAGLASAALLNAQPAFAIPMITTDQFSMIVRDSARSIDRVEFSGPLNVNVEVILVDGSSFGISDVTESSTDPRSPLKIAAICRESQVPTLFVDFQKALAAAPKRSKVYTNPRVQEAAVKEQEKRARMQADEAARIEAQQAYDAAAAVEAASAAK